MQSKWTVKTLSKELLKLLRSNNNQYTMRGKKVLIYDAVLKILGENPDLNINQLTLIIERHGIYGETFKEMLKSFVLNKEIEIYNQGKQRFVRILKSKEQAEPKILEERSISEMIAQKKEGGAE